ncbi:MAG: hypothetical protein U9R75_11225 [Candidatus Thermoplasmatota archaeon]|nr:hypothetical protein [Candidatus Thermoplasmatota archaeon]
MKRDNREMCPVCGIGIDEHLPEGSRFTCRNCGNTFLLKWDRHQRDYIFIDVRDKGRGEPLGLPRGSVRAFVMLLVSLTCWIMFLMGQDVPHYLLNLALIMIGYYFAFRGQGYLLKGLPAVETKDTKQPLHMPKGFIRWIVIGGFLISMVALLVTGGMKGHNYIEFFFILSGLVLGYISKKVRLGLLKMETPGIIKHGRSVLVLSISIFLFLVFLFGILENVGALPIRLSIAVIGFYFGSRS